jgi:hypothetical protein
MNNTYRLSDQTIAQIAKLLQIAILTGTDIIDNIRTIRLVTTDDNQLDPTPEFLENFEINLNRMIATLATQQVEQSGVDE